MRRPKGGSDPYTLNPYSYSFKAGEARNLYRTLAAEANRRMAELEQSASPITGKPYTGWAYKHYGQAVLDGGTRWESDMDDYDRFKLYRRIVQLQAFLGAKSSTVEGARSIEEKTVKTFQSKTASRRGLRGNPADLWDLLESGIVREFEDAGTGSPVVVDLIIGAINMDEKSSEDIKEILNQALDDFRSRKSTPSIKELESRLGVKWLKEVEQSIK